MSAPSHSRGMAIWKWLLLPWVAAVIAMVYLWTKDLPTFPDPPTARIIFWHVPMAMLGLLWFWIGAVHAIRFLYGSCAGDLGLDHKVRYASEVGLACTLLATVTGSVFAYRQWNTAWNWDPKQVGIVVLIVIFLAYFALRMSIDDPGLRARISAVYAIIGAVAAPALMYVIPNLPVIKSLHPPGTTIIGGLDPKWRTIYWLATVGFFGITFWLYELRLRLTSLEAGRPVDAIGMEPRLEAVREAPQSG